MEDKLRVLEIPNSMAVDGAPFDFLRQASSEVKKWRGRLYGCV